jgi:hypothetical protein
MKPKHSRLWPSVYTLLTAVVFVLAFDDETPIWVITIMGLVSAGVCGHLWLLTFGVQLWRDVVSKLLNLPPRA